MRRGFGLRADVPETVVRAASREAEAVGYASFWINHPHEIDGLAVLRPAGQVTRRLMLGIGVIPLHLNDPREISERVSRHRLPGQRLLLGVGSPNPGALARVRTGVTELRPTQSQIVVAALGPQMCRLAGEMADAVLFNWLTPDYARRATGWVEEGARAAGRKRPTTYAYVRVALGSRATTRLQAEARRYGGLPAYLKHFERMNVEPRACAITGSHEDEIQAALSGWEGAVDEVVVRGITANDTAEEVIEVLRAAKPTHPVSAVGAGF